MAPTFFRTVRSLISSQPVPRAADALNTVAGHVSRVRDTLSARSVAETSDSHQPSVDASSGVLDPHDINNVGFFVLFALIGVGFVVTGIWFFFWAKNGGFRFKENDWDDYKSTVLRRKGPNGTLLSGATRSTNLGGGSVYKDVADDDNTTVITDDMATVITGITAGASDIGAREKRKKKQEKRDKDRAKKGKRTSKRVVGDDGVLDEVAEREAKDLLRHYRHEKAARVGGMNKQSEASEWDGSTNAGTESNVSSSLLSDRQRTPTSTPTGTPTKKKAAAGGPGIRKVYSVADRRDDRDAQRARSEARRVREAGRQVRRDFSYQRNNASQSESLLEGYTSVSGSTGTGVSQQTGSTSDLGTKSYHHPLPELRELERARERAREERRARRSGYRRGKTEEDEEEVD